MEIVYKSAKCTVIVDYAHNAVSMESLLTLRDYKPKRLVREVFGCGNRARTPVLDGRDWRKLADLSIITADTALRKVEDILAEISRSTLQNRWQIR